MSERCSCSEGYLCKLLCGVAFSLLKGLLYRNMQLYTLVAGQLKSMMWEAAAAYEELQFTGSGMWEKKSLCQQRTL
jgi:hypothetical protein